MISKKTASRKETYNKLQLTPHSCRHAFASLSASSGMRPEKLQKIIGHAEYSTNIPVPKAVPVDNKLEYTLK